MTSSITPTIKQHGVDEKTISKIPHSHPQQRSSSRLASIYSNYQQSLQKIDALERRLEEKVAEKRHRAVNLLDEMSTCRTSTLRLYVTHTCHNETLHVPVNANANASNTTDPNGNGNANASSAPKTKEIRRNKWTVCIEGRLLVGHKDHAAASLMDATAKQNALADGRSYVTHSDVAVDVGEMTSRERAATRFLHDREGEEIATPIRFAHFFDRISVSFQTFQKKKEVVNMGMGGGGGVNNAGGAFGTMGNSNKRRKSAGSRHHKLPASSLASSSGLSNQLAPKNNYTSNGVVSSLYWNRQRPINPTAVQTGNASNQGPNNTSGGGSSSSNPNLNTLTSALDTNAFHALYTEHTEPIGYENKIIATIRLHRHWKGEQRYKPSKVFCKALLPSTFWPKTSSSSSSGDSAPGTGDATNGNGSGGQSDDNEEGLQKPPPPPPTSNDIEIPKLFTMDECIHFLKMYIAKHHLSDVQDTSFIRNNTAMEQVFGCKTMQFGEMKDILLSRGMLLPSIVGTKYDAPIVLTYVMTKDTGTNFKKEGETNDKVGGEIDRKMGGLTEKADGDGGGDRNRTTSSSDSTSRNEKPSRKRRSTTPSPVPVPVPPPAEEPIANLLSCDIDVDVPHLYHTRTRDILRRIKIREYEYTSCRTKALRTVEYTGASEQVIKERMENVVKNRALTAEGHLQVLQALAKAAPKRSEARMAAHVDARLTLLLDRLVEHGNKAKACWDIIDACEGNEYNSDSPDKTTSSEGCGNGQDCSSNGDGAISDEML